MHPCWGCNIQLHEKCMEEREITRLLKPSGPWYCKKCIREFEEAGLRDVTLDLELMRYLVTNELPNDD